MVPWNYEEVVANTAINIIHIPIMLKENMIEGNRKRGKIIYREEYCTSNVSSYPLLRTHSDGNRDINITYIAVDRSSP